MNRRNFLRNVSGAGVAATLPAWFNAAFADSSCDRGGAAVVAAAFRRASRAGKPLLVLVIPRRREQRWTHGTTLGAYLNCATAEELAPIALAEVVCAQMQDLAAVVPHTIEGEPLMVWVATDRVPTHVEPVVVDDLERIKAQRRRTREPQDAAIDRDIARVAAAIRAALVGGPEHIDRRVEQAMARLTPDQLGALQMGPLDALSAEDVERGAALVWARGPTDAAVIAALANAAATRLRLHRVPGSHWASSGGCGIRVEEMRDREQYMIACGMGHVPAKERRFLYFFANPADAYASDDEE